MYPAITNCSPAPDAERSVRSVGAATLTIETSRMAMNWPTSSTASTVPGRVVAPTRGSERGKAAVAVVTPLTVLEGSDNFPVELLTPRP